MNKSLVIAILNDSLAVIASEMNRLIGEWLEGCFDDIGPYTDSLAAQLQFKFCWSLLKNEQKQAVLDSCVFEKFANELAEENGLEKPYVLESVDEYGISKWKRVRKSLTHSNVIDDLVEYLNDTIWEKARMYRRKLEDEAGNNN